MDGLTVEWKRMKQWKWHVNVVEHRQGNRNDMWIWWSISKVVQIIGGCNRA